MDEAVSRWVAIGDAEGRPKRSLIPAIASGAIAFRPSVAFGNGFQRQFSGWGDTVEGAGAFPDALRVGSVAIADDLACADSYAAVGTTVRPDTMLCAGRTGGGVDTCQGDSGGPMVVPVSGGGFRLVGDTSFGIGCARPEFPGVYGRLADGARSSETSSFLRPGLT